jgi:hypothetical protein
MVIASLALAGLAAGGLVLGRAAPVDEERAAKEADRVFAARLATADHKGIDRMLDRHFLWIDRDGVTRTRRQTLKELPRLAVPRGGASDIETHFYGRMLTVRGTNDNARFLRVLVKRKHGWKPVIVMETPLASAGAPASVERAAGAGDCDNPCRTVPYVPKTPMDKDILTVWQKTKIAEWKPDAAQWASFIADEFMIVNNTTVRNKEQRLAIARRQEEAGIGTPGDPVTAMRIRDAGLSSALMISQHTPYRGGKPYTNVRVWVKRDGRWQLALSQQVDIQQSVVGNR